MSITAKLVGFPLRAIIRNAFGLTPPCGAAFWIREGRASALVARGRRRNFVPSFEDCESAPVLLSPPARNMSFGKLDGVMRGLKADGRYVMAVDEPRGFVSLVQTRNVSAGSVGELRKQPIQALLPMADLPEEFVWEIVSSGFEPLVDSGEVPSSVVVVGLPQRVCWWAEKWVEAVDGVILGIVPSVLAILDWCGSLGRDFVLIPCARQSYLALFAARRLVLLSRLPGTEWLNGSLVESLVSEIRRELDLEPSCLCLYPGEMEEAECDALRSRFREPLQVLGPGGAGDEGAVELEREILRNLFEKIRL